MTKLRLLRRAVAATVALVAFFPVAALAYERDFHYDGVYALLAIHGFKPKQALLIARASQSVDENAETSPLPEGTGVSSSYPSRAAKWHALPPFRIVSGEEEAHFVQRQLNELYSRAVSAPDDRSKEIYFGQYLHALADSVSHEGFHNIIGHPLHDLLSDVGVDIPTYFRLSTTNQVALLVSASCEQFAHDTALATPRKPTFSELQAVAFGLTSNGEAPLDQREEHAREQIEANLASVGERITIPRWGDAGVEAIAFNEDGTERPGPVHPPLYDRTMAALDKLPTAMEAAAGAAAEAAWNTVYPGAMESALGAVATETRTAAAGLGGVDFRHVRLNFVADEPDPDGHRTLAFGFVPDAAGGGDDARLAVSAFAAAVALPDDAWWVNLNPAQPDRIVDPSLGATDAGRVMLGADLLLKTISREVVDPATPNGAAYWKAFSAQFGSRDFSSVWRTWIVPGPCRGRAAGSTFELLDCRLDVRMNLEQMTLDPFIDPALGKRLRQAEIDLSERYILPALRTTVNEDPRFAALRSVYHSRALAQAYKAGLTPGSAFASVAGSSDLHVLPPPTLPAPSDIFATYMADFQAQDHEIRVASPDGEGELVVRTGGIVFDDVAVDQLSPDALDDAPTPDAPGRGLIVARAPSSQPARSPFLSAALAAHAAAGVRADAQSTYHLLDALAMTGDSAYDAVSATRPSGVSLDPSLALRGATPAGDTILFGPYAAWTRLHPLEARKRLAHLTITDAKDIVELLAYLGAMSSVPSADDPDPPHIAQLYDAVIDYGTSGGGRPPFLSLAGAITVQAAPDTAPRISETLLKPAVRTTLYKTPDAVLSVVAVEMLYDVETATTLIIALNESYDGAGEQPTQEVSDQMRRLSRFAARKTALAASIDPTSMVWNARFDWTTQPSAALTMILSAVRGPGASLSGVQRDRLIADASPILAWGAPREAATLAASIQDPACRTEAYAWLAMFAYNQDAAGILLTQELANQVALLGDPATGASS